MNIEQIAEICHEANSVYCQVVMDDYTQPAWDDAPEWQKSSAIKGVQFALDNPDAPISAQHDSWTSEKVAAGWKWGPEKDPIKKEHPCIVPYNELPIEQRRKDALFKAIVLALAK